MADCHLNYLSEELFSSTIRSKPKTPVISGRTEDTSAYAQLRAALYSYCHCAGHCRFAVDTVMALQQCKSNRMGYERKPVLSVAEIDHGDDRTAPYRGWFRQSAY